MRISVQGKKYSQCFIKKRFLKSNLVVKKETHKAVFGSVDRGCLKEYFFSEALLGRNNLERFKTLLSLPVRLLRHLRPDPRIQAQYKNCPRFLSRTFLQHKQPVQFTETFSDITR